MLQPKSYLITKFLMQQIDIYILIIKVKNRVDLAEMPCLSVCGVIRRDRVRKTEEYVDFTEVCVQEGKQQFWMTQSDRKMEEERG